MQEAINEAPRAKSMSECEFAAGSLLGHIRHTITSNKLEVSVFRASLKRPAAGASGKWVSLGRMPHLPVTTITRKALKLIDLKDTIGSSALRRYTRR